MSSSMKPPFVITFVQAHCPACHEFMPRFLAATAKYKHCGVRIFAPDVSQRFDHETQKLADQFKIHATPPTVIVSRDGRVKKLEGGVTQVRLERVLHETLSA